MSKTAAVSFATGWIAGVCTAFGSGEKKNLVIIGEGDGRFSTLLFEFRLI
jgi:hypothetical protein